VQALRVGDIAIATTPTETYAITGLKIKAASPLVKTMVIELANGGDGYIPPPEMHAWGGYNTWAARSAGLEVQAEPKITQAAIGLLETVSGAPRRPWHLGAGPATRAIADLQPAAHWRLNEFNGPLAADASPHGRAAAYLGGVAYSLGGPQSDRFCAAGEINRAPHFVEGRLAAQMPGLKQDYSIALWLWNGLPQWRPRRQRLGVFPRRRSRPERVRRAPRGRWLGPPALPGRQGRAGDRPNRRATLDLAAGRARARGGDGARLPQRRTGN
jgi:hypothetical protein